MVVRFVVTAALLLWIADIATLLAFWSELPVWARGLMVLYSFVIVSDLRIFRIPFNL